MNPDFVKYSNAPKNFSVEHHIENNDYFIDFINKNVRRNFKNIIISYEVHAYIENSNVFYSTKCKIGININSCYYSCKKCFVNEQNSY